MVGGREGRGNGTIKPHVLATDDVVLPSKFTFKVAKLWPGPGPFPA
jgi:hypothetical protein